MPLAALLLALLPFAQRPIDAGRAAEQILERGNYQRELPTGAGGASRNRGAAGDAIDGALEEDAGRGVRPREEDAAGGRARRPPERRASGGGSFALPPGLARAIGWVLLAGLVVAVVVWLLRARSGRDVRLRGGGERAPEPAVAAQFDARTLADAEALAREGRFAEAIRELLAQTFQALRGREGVRLEPWLTSREVLAAARLADGQRASLAQLVDAVERSLFARREPGPEEFEACAREYRSLLEGSGGG